MDTRDIAKLATCSLFRAIPVERFAELMRTAKWQDHRYPKDSLILLQGCMYASLYILLEGAAYAEMSDDEGRCMRMETFAPVEALASAVLFAPKPVLPVTVGAQTECRVISIPREELLRLCMSDKAILEACLSESGQRIQFLSERLRLTRFATLRQRIADWLLRKAQAGAIAAGPTANAGTKKGATDAHTRASPKSGPVADLRGTPREGSSGIRVKVEPSLEKLADLLGVARPSLSRELSRMRNEGLIDMEGRTIILRSLEALRRVRSSKNRPR